MVVLVRQFNVVYTKLEGNLFLKCKKRLPFTIDNDIIFLKPVASVFSIDYSFKISGI